MKITALVGGVGGARFLLGAKHFANATSLVENDTITPSVEPDLPVTAIVNVGDDAFMHGLRICPDLDTCMYTLGGGIDEERGWGRKAETWHAKEELAKYGAKPDWFGLGDRDLATHLIRTQMLNAGYSLSDVTAALCNRWQPGVNLLPATDDRHETHVVVTNPEANDHSRTAIHFQEWWVRYQAQLPTHSFVQVSGGTSTNGTRTSTAAPGVIDAINNADIVFIAPSNPIVSIGAILSVSGIRSALRNTAAKVVGISPVIDNKPLRGMADTCLSVIGVDTTAGAIASHYGARTGSGLLDAWLVSPGEGSSCSEAATAGISIIETPILMQSPAVTANIVRTAIQAVGLE